MTGYLDEENVLNDGFTAYPCATASGGRDAKGDGTAVDEPESFKKYRTIDDDESKSTVYQLSSDLYKGKMVNSGYMNTLRIIEHRNKILSNNIEQFGLSAGSDIHRVPTASDGVSEMDDLFRLVDNIRLWQQNNTAIPSAVHSEYFLPASICYAYEPIVKNGEILSEKFKPHNWFLPSANLLMRFIYYTAINKESKFKGAISIGAINRLYAVHWTSCEVSTNGAYSISSNNGMYFQ